MANPEHLEILRSGVDEWDFWRFTHPEAIPNLSGANLYRADLEGADLRGVSKLKGKRFYGILPIWVWHYSHLSLTNLVEANLAEADLKWANLNFANLNGADLRGADLEHAALHGTNLSGAKLDGTDFDHCKMDGTIFGTNDLSRALGLDTVIHRGPSTIGFDTIYLSQGRIPETFLRGTGLSDWQIEMAKLYQPDLSNEKISDILYRIYDLRAHQAIQISPLFISYSHADSPFVNEVEKYLNKKGIRFWRDVHNATAGRLERQVDRAIRLNPTVLLVLSSHSVRSDWVQHEARLARNLEVETERDVLCPVALDDSWKDCTWPARLREQIMEYNILNFSGWRNEDNFQRMFTRLLDGLDLFYK
jgi:uncharacterized protein YjbI with pentapeptide repeats